MFKYSKGMEDLKAVILAAGEGLRLQPLTDNRPKHLIPIACKPILDHLLENVAKCNISEALLVVGRWKDMIQQSFGDGRSKGLRISYAVQPAVLGTAHAIGMAQEFVGQHPFLALYGDIYVASQAVERVVETFEKKTCQAAMAVVPVSTPQFFGIVTVKNGCVESIVEKPSKPAEGNLANAGIFAFSPSIFETIQKTGKSERGEFEITESLRLLIQSGAEVRATELKSGTWKDIGRPWDLLDANELALRNIRPDIKGKVEDGARLVGPIVVENDVVVRSGTYIEGPAIISNGAELGPNCHIRPHTSVGRNVKIGNACEVKNSIVMNDTKIPHLSYVGDSIIGERCNLGAGTILANLRFDERAVRMMISGSLVDSGRAKLGAVIGDDVQTGINVSVMPGVKVGSGSLIDPGVTLDRDVPPRKRVVLTQKHQVEPIGDATEE